MENQHGCFFNHLFKGFLVGFFSWKTNVHWTKICLLLTVHRKCKSKHLEQAVKLLTRSKNTQVSLFFFSWASDRVLPFLSSTVCTPSIYSRWCNYSIIFYFMPPPTYTLKHTHATPPPPIAVQFQSSACVILFYLASPPPLGPIWWPFLLCRPHHHNPTHGLHISYLS